MTRSRAARLARMRHFLSEHNVLSSKQAQVEFGVSEMTVRRDFAALVASGHADEDRCDSAAALDARSTGLHFWRMAT